MKNAVLIGLIASVCAMVGCGGSSSSSNNPPPNPTLQSIAVTPATPSIVVKTTQQFVATGTYSDGSTKNLTSSANWLSSTTSVASISTSGLATAAGAGTTNITATVGTVTGNTMLTVTNPLVSIAVTPTTATIGLKGQQVFIATGTFADGSTQTLTSGVTWTSSNTGVAAINSAGLAVAVAAGTTNITASQNTITSNTAVLTVVANPLKSIAVTPNPVSVSPIPPNNTQQFTATGTYADGSMQNITNSVTWSASSGATITSSGLATAVTPNATVTIMATDPTTGISGTAIMNVTNPLVSIAVTPNPAKIASGTTQQFVATGTYADNSTQVITSTVTWASSNTSVATISNSPGTQGLATGLTVSMPSTTNITATLNGVTSPNDVLTVTNATLVSIAVTPAGVQIPLASQQQYTATGTFSDGTHQNITNTVTWASSDTAHIRITVSGLATGVATTNTAVTISATQSSITGSTTATVIPPTVVSIAITPNLTQMAQNTSRQYTATATLTNGSTLNVTGLGTWSSSNTSIATVAGGLVSAQPVTMTSNPVTIMVTYNSVSQSITLDVTNATPSALTVTPALQTIPVGVTERYSATCTFSDGTSQDVTLNTTWTSTMTGVATINSFGTATGVSPGSTTIQGSFLSVNGSTTLTISTATLASIAVKPPSVVLAPGSTLTYLAIGTYSDSTTQIISGQVTWGSTNPTVVSITTGGVATGQSAGTAMITAKYQGITGTGNVVVEGSSLVSIAVTVPVQSQPYTVPFDVSVQFQATGTFADNSTQNLTTNVTWASSQPSVATISNSVGRQGLATGVSAGQTEITAVFASIAGNATLNVTNATLVSITVTPANQNVSVGTQVNYTAVGKFSDGSTVDLTGQCTWVSTTPTVATINNLGQASAASAGTTSIQATFVQNGVSVTGMTNLTVH